MPSATSSNYLHQKQMDYLLKGTAWTPPASGSIWVALFTTAPDLNDENGVEVSTTNTSYARMEVGTWNGPSADTTMIYSNAADITFPTPSGNWGTISAAGLYDAEVGGNLLYVANLTSSKTVNNGDGAPKILAGQLKISRAIC